MKDPSEGVLFFRSRGMNAITRPPAANVKREPTSWIPVVMRPDSRTAGRRRPPTPFAEPVPQPETRPLSDGTPRAPNGPPRPSRRAPPCRGSVAGPQHGATLSCFNARWPKGGRPPAEDLSPVAPDRHDERHRAEHDQ